MTDSKPEELGSVRNGLDDRVNPRPFMPVQMRCVTTKVSPTWRTRRAPTLVESEDPTPPVRPRCRRACGPDSPQPHRLSLEPATRAIYTARKTPHRRRLNALLWSTEKKHEEDRHHHHHNFRSGPWHHCHRGDSKHDGEVGNKVHYDRCVACVFGVRTEVPACWRGRSRARSDPVRIPPHQQRGRWTATTQEKAPAGRMRGSTGSPIKRKRHIPLMGNSMRRVGLPFS